MAKRSRRKHWKGRRIVFHIYSLTVAELIEIIRSPQRLGRYGSDLGIVEVTKGHWQRHPKWRLENCRRFTPRALLSRHAFLLLARTLGVPLRRLERRRELLGKHGFNRNRQRRYASLIRRRCLRQLSVDRLSATMTCPQVIAAVLRSPTIQPKPKKRTR